MTVVEPVPAILPPPSSPLAGVRESLSMWTTVAAAMRAGRRRPGGEMLLPCTLPVISVEDVTPYHFIAEPGGDFTFRKGAPPSAVSEAAAQFASGALDLNGFLDRIGVPKASS